MGGEAGEEPEREPPPAGNHQQREPRGVPRVPDRDAANHHEALPTYTLASRSNLDPFGNYYIHELIRRADEDAIDRIVCALEPSLVRLSKGEDGGRE